MTNTNFPTLGFTKLVVNDLDASAKFYEAIFGLKQRTEYRETIAGRRVREYVYPKDDGTGSKIILLTFETGPRPVPGEMIVGATTSDVASVVARVKALGGSVIQPPFETKVAARPLMVAFVADPEGHMIELTQPL